MLNIILMQSRISLSRTLYVTNNLIKNISEDVHDTCVTFSVGHTHCIPCSLDPLHAAVHLLIVCS